MGNRATCPVCGSYSSSIFADINDGKDCRSCGCPNDILEKYQEILKRKEAYRGSQENKKLMDENLKLEEENAALKTKLAKLTDIFGHEWDEDNILARIKKTMDILKNDPS